ncbi:glutaredoxin family protein [Candidatus Uhrbacteria bacterium]|nr:glutaredoxin family protein [Candidatus Uhrbacteria bacterium]
MSITIYTKDGCPWCADALALLREKGVSFTEKECRNNQANFDELVKKSGQTLTPTLDIDGEILADSDAPAIAAFLKVKGVEGF